MARSARLALLAGLALVLGLPGAGYAFDASNPAEVGFGLFPFEPDREEDASVAFLLEDYLQANLPRAIRHPVYTGKELGQALPTGVLDCIEDQICIRMLGGQFNVSLVARVQVFRSGSEIQLEVGFYTTGNGILIGRENTAFQSGDERSMVDAFDGWFQLYFDTSLRVSASNRAGEGGVMGTTVESEQARRVEEYKEGRKKKVSSRRTDFDEGPNESSFDRDDPTGDLRALVGDDDDDDDQGRGGRRTSTRREDATSSYDVSDDDLDLDDDRTSRSSSSSSSSRSTSRSTSRSNDRSNTSSSRTARPTGSDDDIDLDSRDERGGSVNTYTDTQRAGYSPREYKRYTKSGLNLDTYAERRWETGGRFYLRAGGYYGGGWLTRRYATVVFVRVGNVKTDEYGWERLGPSKFGNPGGHIGFGFAPHRLIAVELDVGMMYAQQDLRREYDGHEIGTNVREDLPQTQPTSHLVMDLRGRFMLPPAGRVKFTPGVGVTLVVMQGFQIPAEEPLNYTSRPVAGVLGVTPLAGVVLGLSPFMALNIDLSGTIYLTQGAAKYEDHLFFNGVTEAYLPDSSKQPPIAEVPLMGRLAVSAMIFF